MDDQSVHIGVFKIIIKSILKVLHMAPLVLILIKEHLENVDLSW